MYKTEWTHNPVALSSSQQKTLDFEIADISEQLDNASDLIFHTIRLSDSWDGPIIVVDGREDVVDTLYLTYYETPEWITLNDSD